MSTDTDHQRRRLLLAGTAGLGVVAGSLRAAATAGPTPPAAAVDEGVAAAGKVQFSPISAASEPLSSTPPNPDAPSQRVGFAVMGLGRLSLEHILPAFAQSKHARLTGLISGNPEKMRTVAAQYGVPTQSCYGYEDIPKLRGNTAVDAVYVVLPNALHRNAVVQLAAAGKHVLCEKPMALDVAEAREMIDACRRADRKLMIAYRCQYEVSNKELARRARAGDLGKVQFIEAVNTQNQGDPSQWRQVKSLAGGGSLPDVGLYCLNTARALLGEEPVEVTATIESPVGDPRFKEVESTVSFTLRFPSGAVANCASSYSLHQKRHMSVMGSSAHAYIVNAFAYEGQRLHLSRRDGDFEVDQEVMLGVKNQFALELDHMAACIRHNVQPRTPGEEGLQDQIIMAAIYEAAHSHRAVALSPGPRIDAFRGPEPAKDV